jgi:hypothetical protein
MPSRASISLLVAEALDPGSGRIQGGRDVRHGVRAVGEAMGSSLAARLRQPFEIIEVDRVLIRVDDSGGA